MTTSYLCKICGYDSLKNVEISFTKEFILYICPRCGDVSEEEIKYGTE